MVWIIIVVGLTYVLALIWNNVTDNKGTRLFSALILTILAISFVTLFIIYNDRNTPTAKSVYEGKTTLEITYRDSIPVDTIVVLKPEFLKK